MFWVSSESMKYFGGVVCLTSQSDWSFHWSLKRDNLIGQLEYVWTIRRYLFEHFIWGLLEVMCVFMCELWERCYTILSAMFFFRFFLRWFGELSLVFLDFCFWFLVMACSMACMVWTELIKISSLIYGIYIYGILNHIWSLYVIVCVYIGDRNGILVRIKYGCCFFLRSVHLENRG